MTLALGKDESRRRSAIPGISAARAWWRPLVAPALSLALIGAAIYLLHEFTRGISLFEIRNALSATSGRALLLAFLATAVSFCALAGFDIVATRAAVRKRVEISGGSEAERVASSAFKSMTSSSRFRSAFDFSTR